MTVIWSGCQTSSAQQISIEIRGSVCSDQRRLSITSDSVDFSTCTGMHIIYIHLTLTNVVHVDICTLGYHNCHPNATCSVVGGTSTSCACNTGFVGDGFNCTNEPTTIMTCTEVICFPSAACEMVNDFPQCVCSIGHLAFIYPTCVPVISELPQCVYNLGFVGDGLNCTDQSAMLCSVFCDRNAVCTIFSDALQCVCKSGFVGNGLVCARIDPCDRVRCDPNAMCIADDNSQTAMCMCNAGFTGDGRVCASLEACNATCLTIQTNLHCVVLQSVIECTSPRVQQLFETVSLI